MNYSITKAKFYLIFPLFLSFNQYRPQHRIELTEEEMKEKIEQYLSKIKESKVKTKQNIKLYNNKMQQQQQKQEEKKWT